MPDITIHIDTNNLTPEEIRQLRQDIVDIKQRYIEFARAIVSNVSAYLNKAFRKDLATTSAFTDRDEREEVILSELVESTYKNDRVHKTNSGSVGQETRASSIQVADVKRGFRSLPISSYQSSQVITDLTTVQRSIINTIAEVPSDLLSATHEALITIPAQTQEVLQQLKAETELDIADINNSEVLSAQEKAARIEQIERNAAQRRKEIEAEANQAKIASFNRVVANFVRGIGRMIAEQLKLRIANQILSAQQTFVPFLSAHPVLSIGAAALFSGSFDDPINDALAQQSGIRQAQQHATTLGRRSAIDLKQNFEMGFVRETERQVGSPQRIENPAPVVKNEVKLIIGGQELKAIYEETQRQIAMGIISE